MRIGFLVCALTLALDVAAQADPYVPPELEPWRAWVLQGHEEVACPYAKAIGYTCRWPGVLELTVAQDGASFAQRWRVVTSGWIALPGDLRAWPVQVRVDGNSVPVAERNGGPALYLEPGEHVITGQFDWRQMPERLSVPASVGIVRLDGVQAGRPRWDGNALLLAQPRAGVREENSLNLSVARLFSDGVPQTLTTAIRLAVAGTAREERLGPVVLDGFKLLGVNTELPVRVDEQGVLYAQLRPGTWTITVDSRATAPMSQIGPPTAEPPWPAQEVWGYRSDAAIRVTSVEGASPIDPMQTQMPDRWRSYPAYLLSAGDHVQIVQHSRGVDLTGGNELRLQRDMWLRFDGEGWVIEDRITGTMVQDWRLGMAEPYRLTRLEEGGEPRLLTRLEADAPVGAEVRRASTAVHAVSELDAGLGGVPASGWTTSFQSLDTQLHLPPGYRLFAVSGYDASRGDWLSQWGLISIFAVILVAVSAARLFGLAWGAVALAALVLTVHEPDAPMWLWLNALLALGLLGLLSAGWLKRVVAAYAALAMLALLVAYVPFALQQARLALYPQLAGAEPVPIERKAASRPAPREAGIAVGERYATQDVAELERVEVTGSRIPAPEPVSPYAPDALIQAGIAAPEWHWDRVSLALSGPVRPQQTASYWVFPPWLTGLWRVAGIAFSGVLLGWLIMQLVGKIRGGWRRKTAAAAMVMLLAVPGLAAAQTPDPQLLKELESRLTQLPACAPECAQIQRVEIEAGGGSLEIRLDVHALSATAIALPGTRDGWTPSRVDFEGAARPWLLQQNGALWAPIPEAGEYRLTLGGPMPDANAFNLSFPARPKRVSLSVEGWEVSGLQDGRVVADALRFVRLEQATADEAAEPRQVHAPPFVIVQRDFQLGVDWKINTRVERRAPDDAAFSVAMPLLAGESVVTDDPRIAVTGTELRMTFPAGVDRIQFSSRIPEASPLELQAAESGQFRQRWSFVVSHIWHARFEGLAPVSTVQSGGRFSPLYFPRPGETLTIAVTRPQAVAGETLSVTRARLTTQVGLRGRETSLNFQYRATRGGAHTVGLPEGVTLRGLSLDGQSVGAVPVDGEVTFSVQPGSHEVALRWQQPTGDLLAVSTPQPQLNAAAANISLELNLPQDRWVLWASGPRMGPVVMYWSELALMLAVALILGRFKRLPLSPVQWVLLGFGLSLTAWPVILILFAWLMALDWRGRHGEKLEWRSFDLLQLGLFAASVIVLGALFFAILMGLLSSPDMGIIGHGSSSNSLRWFADYSDGSFPQGTVISLPLWCYKAFILLWSVWLSLALIQWLKWAWGKLSEGGLWRSQPVVEPDSK